MALLLVNAIGKTPFGVHDIWCLIHINTESGVPTTSTPSVAFYTVLIVCYTYDVSSLSTRYAVYNHSYTVCGVNTVLLVHTIWWKFLPFQK